MTAAEAARRISMRELQEWGVFEETFGPLTIHERLDAAVAHIAYTVHATAGGQLPPEHFVPRWQKPRVWTEDEVFAWLDAVATREQK